MFRETASLESLYGGQITLPSQLNFSQLKIRIDSTRPRRRTTVSLETNPLIYELRITYMGMSWDTPFLFWSCLRFPRNHHR